MGKKKVKVTLAYKQGYAAGLKSRHHNTYAVGSSRFTDYEQGYVAALKSEPNTEAGDV